MAVIIDVKSIVIKIKLLIPQGGTLLHDISGVIERFLKRRGVPFERIEAAVKFDDDE